MRKQFTNEPNLRKRAGQFLTALLPPKRRRKGRPGRPDVSMAIRLLKKFRRGFPAERGEKLWARIYPEAIAGCGRMTDVEQGYRRLC